MKNSQRVVEVVGFVTGEIFSLGEFTHPLLTQPSERGSKEITLRVLGVSFRETNISVIGWIAAYAAD